VIGFTGGAIPEVKVNRLLLNNVDAVGVVAEHGHMQRRGAVGISLIDLRRPLRE